MFDAKKIKDEIVNWIRDYFAANGPECLAVIGISGGKDSSIVAALCCEALGCERVLGVLMPQGEQTDIDVAYDLVTYLGIKHHVVNIGDVSEALIGKITELYPENNRQAIVNTPARIRMSALYAVCACVNGRVANTSNLSEEYVGYATKFGVGSSGDFSALSKLTVTEVKKIGRCLNLPERFIEKVPLDGLSGLTDEENLGFTYEVLDRYIREGVCDDPVIKVKIDRLHSINMHKLLPTPCYEF